MAKKMREKGSNRFKRYVKDFREIEPEDKTADLAKVAQEGFHVRSKTTKFQPFWPQKMLIQDKAELRHIEVSVFYL